MSRKLKTPIRIRRKRVKNQGVSGIPNLLAAGAAGFLATGLSAAATRWFFMSREQASQPFETFTMGQFGLQLATAWGGNKILDTLKAEGAGRSAYASGAYLSVAVTGLGLLAKNASPETKKFLGVGHGWSGNAGPSGATDAPPKLDKGKDQMPTKSAKLIYDPIAGRVAGFWLSDAGYAPISTTLVMTDKDSNQVFFLTANKELLVRPSGAGPWIALPQGTSLPSIDTSGVDFSASSPDVGTRVRLISGPSTDAGHLVDITQSTKLPYRVEEGTDVILVKEPSDGAEYIAMSSTGYPLGVENGKVVSWTADRAPALGYGIPTAPMFAAHPFLIGGPYRG